MTIKVNGFVEQGSWFERDTSVVTATVVFADPGVDDFEFVSVGGAAEQIMRVLQTRGTVIGYTATAADVAGYLFGTSAGSFKGVFDAPKTGVDPDVMAELEASITALPGVTSVALVVSEGVAGADPILVTRS